MKQPILLLTAMLALAQAKPDRKFDNVDRTRFLVVAVFEGLLEDGADVALLAPLLKDPDKYFVVKCPVCWPVIDGMKTYIKLRENMSYPSEGSGFPEDLKAGLKSPDRAARLKAIEALVDRYVSRRFETTVMTAGEKEQIKSLLIMAKKYGTTIKPESFGSFCPSCNGATKGGK
jgi:hypothetical protein